jgi:alpha,alpha-trehalose phosphorylase
VWDFANCSPDEYPLLLHYPYFELYRKQVVKQADLILAMHLCGDRFTLEEKRRAFDHYEGLTVRDSSLSASTQAVIAAEVGHTELAYDYLAEAALMDLHDLNQNTHDGVHIASLAGAVSAAVAGLGGMREIDHQLGFRPRLPRDIKRLAFNTTSRGRRLRVEIERAQATYIVHEGDPLVLHHYGEELRVAADAPVTRPIPDAPELDPPSQPHGCAPKVRRDQGE